MSNIEVAIHVREEYSGNRCDADGVWMAMIQVKLS